MCVSVIKMSLITSLTASLLSPLLFFSTGILKTLRAAFHMMGFSNDVTAPATEIMSNSSCKHLTKDTIDRFIGSFDNVLSDCDGVLWNGKLAIEGSSDALGLLQKLGKKVFYVTNNSTETRSNYVEKLKKYGYAATEESIYCTANAIAGYLQKLKFNQTAYVIGSKGLADALDEVAIKHVGTEPDVMPDDFYHWYTTLKLLPNIGAVIVGLDFNISFGKLMKAACYLKDPNCLFIASNMDTRFPMRHNEFVVPGTGALVTAVMAAAGRQPIVIGKPNTAMFEAIAHQHGLDPSRTIMIGDRLDTDMLLGSNCGLRTLLVLTGISSLDEVRRCQSSDSVHDKKLIPDYYLNRLGDLVDLLK